MSKRGSLKSAGKRQENATFLQCSFFNVALQFFACCSAAFGQNDIRAAESQCCSATSAAQHSENCSATSVFACGMLQGWGFEGWGLGLADTSLAVMVSSVPPKKEKHQSFWRAGKAIKSFADAARPNL